MRKIKPTVRQFRIFLTIVSGLILLATPARAELILDKLVVELRIGDNNSDDLVVWNNSDERAYVLIEPNRIISPGTTEQKRISVRDPRELGLLASPQRMVMEPGQQRLLRLATLHVDSTEEQVYRVTVRPIVNEDGDQDGLQLLVGYDLLVLVRPANVEFAVHAHRSGKAIHIDNTGNTSVELLKIRQCDPTGKCAEMDGKRLYSGMQWSTELVKNTSAELFFNTPEGTKTLTVK
jgi:P pilus assembly chaperone PapD